MANVRTGTVVSNQGRTAVTAGPLADPGYLFGPQDTDLTVSPEFIVEECPIILRAYGLVDDEKVCVEMVDGCGDTAWETHYIGPLNVGAGCVDDACQVCLSACRSMLVLPIPGRYRLVRSESASNVIVTGIEMNTSCLPSLPDKWLEPCPCPCVETPPDTVITSGDGCVTVTPVSQNAFTLDLNFTVSSCADPNNILTVNQVGCIAELCVVPPVASIVPAVGTNGGICLSVVDDGNGNISIANLIDVVASGDPGNSIVVTQVGCTYEIFSTGATPVDYLDSAAACAADPGSSNLFMTEADYFTAKHAYVHVDPADTGVVSHPCIDIVIASLLSRASGTQAGVYSSNDGIANGTRVVAIGSLNVDVLGVTNGVYSSANSTVAGGGHNVVIGSDGASIAALADFVSSVASQNNSVNDGLFVAQIAVGGVNPSSTINGGVRIVDIAGVGNVINGGSSVGVISTFNSTVDPSIVNVAILNPQAEQIFVAASDNISTGGNEVAIIASRGGATDSTGNTGARIRHGQRAVLLGTRDCTIGIDVGGVSDASLIAASTRSNIESEAAFGAGVFNNTILSTEDSQIVNMTGGVILSSRAVRMDDASGQHGNWAVSGGVGPAGAPSSANKTWLINSVNGEFIGETGFTTAAVADFGEVYQNYEEGEIPPGTPVSLFEGKVYPSAQGDISIGIVSRTTRYLGNDGPVEPKFLTDEWGAVLYERDNADENLMLPVRNPNFVDDVRKSELRDKYSVVGHSGLAYARCSKQYMRSGQPVAIGQSGLLEYTTGKTNWIASECTSEHAEYDIWLIHINGVLYNE